MTTLPRVPELCSVIRPVPRDFTYLDLAVVLIGNLCRVHYSVYIKEAMKQLSPWPCSGEIEHESYADQTISAITKNQAYTFHRTVNTTHTLIWESTHIVSLVFDFRCLIEAKIMSLRAAQ